MEFCSVSIPPLVSTFRVYLPGLITSLSNLALSVILALSPFAKKRGIYASNDIGSLTIVIASLLPTPFSLQAIAITLRLPWNAGISNSATALPFLNSIGLLIRATTSLLFVVTSVFKPSSNSSPAPTSNSPCSPTALIKSAYISFISTPSFFCPQKYFAGFGVLYLVIFRTPLSTTATTAYAFSFNLEAFIEIFNLELDSIFLGALTVSLIYLLGSFIATCATPIARLAPLFLFWALNALANT